MTAQARWALGFADLCLLLLGFFILLQAQGRDPAMAAGVRAAFGAQTIAARAEWPARKLFEPGEAVLRADARRSIAGLGRKALSQGRGLRVDSVGRDRGTGRFDGWELAAARVAAIARAAAEGGLPADRIEVAMPAMAEGQGPQRLAVTLR